jgi:DNA-binding NarL/FixJ family response regulator
MGADVPTRVLLVDDDPHFRRQARRMLGDMGLKVAGEAENMEAAVAAAQQLQPDAALVDVTLPDGDGLALSLLLRGLRCRPRIVLTSGDRTATTSVGAHRAGAEGFVPKDELPTDKLRALLEGEGAPM